MITYFRDPESSCDILCILRWRQDYFRTRKRFIADDFTPRTMFGHKAVFSYSVFHIKFVYFLMKFPSSWCWGSKGGMPSITPPINAANLTWLISLTPRSPRQIGRWIRVLLNVVIIHRIIKRIINSIHQRNLFSWNVYLDKVSLRRWFLGISWNANLLSWIE